jgi:nucleotide-binding universal stress UspA family protein
MYARILVPLDGSERAERALPVAARIACASGAQVILLRVVRVPVPLTSVFAPTTYDAAPAASMEASESQAKEYLEQIAGSPTLAGLATEIVVPVGAPAAAILDAVGAHAADLIVMCSHGATGLTRWVLGSVAQHVARHAPVPVLVLRESGPIPAGPHPDPEQPLRILVPLDGSQLAQAALGPAADLAVALSAPMPGTLHLALVISPYEAAQDNMPEAFVREGAKEYLAGVVDRLGASTPAYGQLTITWSVGVGLDVATTLVRIAENGEDAEGAGILGGCDLIAMATHGRTGLARWALGSVTERVLHATALPVLIVRPQRVAREEQPALTSAHTSDFASWPGLF